MKKTLSTVLILALSLTSAEAFSCEKWKSEIGWAVVDIGKYISLYAKFEKSKISESDFKYKSNELINKLAEIKSRAETVASCTDDTKFENRRVALLDALNISIGAITGGKYLAPAVKEDLQRHDN